MTDISNELSQVAVEMNQNLDSVSGASDRVMDNISSVAAATEQMSGTITEIAKNSEKARTISDQAVSFTRDTSELVDALGKAAFQINHVTETINEISEQTNLLALNATIEAARAGEAGKGFAVVANEIKELAGQTSNASMDIKENIDNIQLSSTATLGGMEEISQVISDVNEIVAAIAAAVEEQSSAIREISENISQASTGIEEVNLNVNESSGTAHEITMDIGEVNQAAGRMRDRSGQVQASAGELSGLAAQLNEMVGRFAAVLKANGIKKGDSVAILLPNVIPCVVAYYATLRIGAIVVLNNPLYSDRELEHQFTDSNSSFLITLDLLADRVDVAKALLEGL